MGYLWITQKRDLEFGRSLPNTEGLLITGSLYNHVLYTVIPKDQSIKSGILPEDQKFSNNYVILWDSYRDLVLFDEDQWKKVSINIPTQARFNQLTRLGNGFALPFIPNQWEIEELETFPLYEE